MMIINKRYSSINSLNTECDTILVDFNCPDINWSTLSATTPFSISLCNELYSKNFIQLVNEPTHYQGNTLDLILTNSPHRLQNVQVQSSGSSLQSDHFPITISILSSPLRAHTTPASTVCPSNYAKANKQPT